jgi:aryl-alcohol dehydrogenase-like predicted oxidoreductase
MIKRALGSTGLAVSALGLGCNNFGGRLDLERTKAVVDAAIEAGVNFIDTADAYGKFWRLRDFARRDPGQPPQKFDPRH